MWASGANVPLYDQYGKSVSTTDTTPRVASQSKAKLKRALQRWRAWFRSLKPFARYTLEILGLLAVLLGIFWGVLAARQEILIDPSNVSYDQKEAFGQQFTITNNGPFNMYGVHYSCAVSSIRLNDGTSGGWLDTAIYEMVPITKPWIPKLKWKKKTTTDCDFIARFGPQLKSVRI